MLRRHNARWILTRTDKNGSNKNQDPLVDEVLNDLDGPKGQLYKECLDIQETKIKRVYLEACLFCSNNFERISEILEMPLDLVIFYSEFFYDVKDYDRLSKLEMLDKIRDKEELVLKTWALHQGMEFISWRLGKHVIISPTEGLNELFNTCMYKSKEALFNSNSSAASIESTKWVKLSLDIARLLKLWNTDTGGANKELELAIREVLPTFKSFDDIMEEVTINTAEETGDVSDDIGDISEDGTNNGNN